MKVIGICGVKKSGKSEVAKEIEKMYVGTKVVRLPFASIIKQIMANFVSSVTNIQYNDALELFNNPDKKELIIKEIGTSPRVLMTSFGTDFARKLNPNIWVNAINNTINKLNQLTYTHIANNGTIVHSANNDIVIIIDDVRFENELSFLRSINADIVFVARNFETLRPSPLVKMIMYFKILFGKMHISEKGLYHLISYTDIVIVNKGTLLELNEKVNVLCRKK